MATTYTYLKWNNSGVGSWSGNAYTWDEVRLAEEVADAVNRGGIIGLREWEKKQPEKRKRLVTLICKVQGKTIKETAEAKDTEITLAEIELVIREVLTSARVLTERVGE